MERTAIPVPLACYGYEQSLTNKVCQECLHRKPCAEMMGARLNQSSIVNSKFDLIPKTLTVNFSFVDEVNQTFLECHRMIFKHDSTYRISDEEKVKELQNSLVKENCPLKMFILTVMWAHKQANPTASFYPKLLFIESAIRRIRLYRHEVEAIYGTFTEKSLSLFSGENLLKKDGEDQIFNGEIIAGHWILNYKIKFSGKVEDKFFIDNEFQLPLLWLALEPEYYSFTQKFKESESTKKVRIQVSKLVAELKKDLKRSMLFFRYREKIMPLVIQKVLNEKGFDSNMFKTSVEWTSTLKFWSRTALALQQYWCWNLIKGNTNAAIKHLASGNVDIQ